VIPNAILITTESEKHFLTSFTSRDKAYVILFRLWQNALMDKPMNPQELWQSVNNFHHVSFSLTLSLLSVVSSLNVLRTLFVQLFGFVLGSQLLRRATGTDE